MSETSRKINAFFRGADREDVERLVAKVLLSERQERIFSMFYVRRNDICLIADTLCVSPETVRKELSKIRARLLPALPEK